MHDWFPENISTFGGDIDATIHLITAIVGVWFFAAEGVLLAFMVMYRRKAGVKAAYVRGDTMRTAAWVLIPGFFVLICDLAIDHASADTWHRVKEQIPAPDLVVGVRGEQFAWEFTHPGQDGKLGTDDDILDPFELHVPINKVVEFRLSAKDVLHSFWLPNLRLKQDAVPGRTIRGWFEATKTGVWPIACAELCGLGHTRMRGELHVQTEADLQAWMKSEYED